MNRALFKAQLNTAWDIAILLGLDKYRVWYPDYASFSTSNFGGLSYLGMWERCLRDQIYDFLLNDNSLLQFRVDSFSPLKANFAYLECPYKCLSYDDFVKRELGYDIHVVGDELTNEYESYILSCSLKDMVTPVRYDYDPERYQEGRHPASHIHFGYGNNIRVGTRRVLVKPLSFLLLIIRQCYPDHWSILLQHVNASVWCSNVRETLDCVDATFWGPKDQYEMILH